MGEPQRCLPLFVERWGDDGPPVVLLHGIGGSSRYWHGLAAVAGGYRATAPDLLGFGRSPRPDQARYDVEEHLAHLEPLIAPGSVVVAHSTGAVLAAALAVRRPDLVKALLLIGAPLCADVPEARREVRRLGLLARVTAAGEMLGRLTMIVLHTLVQPLSRWLPLGLPREVVEDFWKHSWRSYSRTLRRVVVGHPSVPDLEQLAVPCTLLYGADDSVASRNRLAELLRRNARLTHLTVPGTHHLPVRQPERVADALSQLLGRLPEG
jgi:pimeloyl-ACP methyl ester carboxylesterase